MTRERAKELLPVIQAFAEGKTIEFKSAVQSVDKFENNSTPTWCSGCDYRIKPEPREWYISIHEGFNLEVSTTKPTKFELESPFKVVKVREVLDED